MARSRRSLIHRSTFAQVGSELHEFEFNFDFMKINLVNIYLLDKVHRSYLYDIKYLPSASGKCDKNIIHSCKQSDRKIKTIMLFMMYI